MSRCARGGGIGRMEPRRGERELPVYARVLALMDQLLSPENAIFKQRELALYFILGPLNIPEITMNCLKLPFNHIPRTFSPKFGKYKISLHWCCWCRRFQLCQKM